MSDTPRTDTATDFTAPEKLRDLCRQLERELAQVRKELGEARQNKEQIHILFDGPPSHISGRFIEVENDEGASINAGEWKERADGLWELVIQTDATERAESAERQLSELKACWAGATQLLSMVVAAEEDARLHASGSLCEKELDNIKDFLSSTPASIQNILAVLEAGKRLTEPDPEDDDLRVFKEAYRKWTGEGG